MRFLFFFLISLFFFNADAMSMWRFLDVFKKPSLSTSERLKFDGLRKAVLENDLETAGVLLIVFSRIIRTDLKTGGIAKIINAVDLKGNTLLLLAVYKESPEMGKLLLRNGANPNVVNLYGYSPLLLVVGNWEKGPNKSAFIRDLIKYGANTEVLSGYFPLDRLSLEDIKFLLGHNPRLANAKIERGGSETVLFYAIRKGREGDPFLAKFFLKRGADPNIVNPSGETPLSLVLNDWKAGPIKSAFIKDLILKYGAKTQDLMHLLPVERLNLEDFKFLLDHDPMLVNAKIERFVVASTESVLFYAIRKGREGDPSLAKLFLEKGSDPNVFDPFGETPLSLVLLYWEEGPIKSAFIKDLIFKYGANTKVLLNLFFPVDKLNLEDIKFLLSLEPGLVNVKVLDYAGSLNSESILSYAVRSEDLSLVEFLLKNGANPNEVSYDGQTPSSMAKQNSCFSLFESVMSSST